MPYKKLLFFMNNVHYKKCRIKKVLCKNVLKKYYTKQSYK